MVPGVSVSYFRLRFHSLPRDRGAASVELCIFSDARHAAQRGNVSTQPEIKCLSNDAVKMHGRCWWEKRRVEWGEVERREIVHLPFLPLSSFSFVIMTNKSKSFGRNNLPNQGRKMKNTFIKASHTFGECSRWHRANRKFEIVT